MEGAFMPQNLPEYAGRMKKYLLFFLRWTTFGLLAGIACGVVGAVFHHAVDFGGQMFAAHGWLLYLLPIAGLVIVWLYQLAGNHLDEGANLVLISLRSGTPVSITAAFRIFAGTVLTHLCGGSAGREGAALLIGAGVVSCFDRIFRLEGDDSKQMNMCGTSALFSAVFGTPITAAIFSLEVSSVGCLRYTALYPCLVSSLTGWGVSRFCRTSGVVLPAVALPPWDAWTFLRVAVLALSCALCSIVFISVMHLVGHWYRHYFANPYIRVAVGGVLVVIVTLLLGSRDYNGAGMGIVAAAVSGDTVPWAFLAKIFLTALTINAGFKGGEIVPAFFIGACFGCTLGPLLGLAPGFAAAVGIIALFCSVVNCPLASVLLSVELFGGEGLCYFALACGVSYLMSGYYTLYTTQKFVYPKLERISRDKP